MNLRPFFVRMKEVRKLLYLREKRSDRMPQNKIETGFQLLETSIKLIQTALEIPFIDAYIENGENMTDGYQVRVLDHVPDEETKGLIEANYQEFQQLELTSEEKRKVSQLLLLKGTMAEPLQANHQLTPDALGFLFAYLVEALVGKTQPSVAINDLTVGMGNLIQTVMLSLRESYSVKGTGVDVDDALLAVAAVNAQWFDTPLQLFHQDSLQHLLVEPADVAVADLPIGFYPNDEHAQRFVTGAKDGHSYAHHLLMEQSMTYVKENGFGLFLVPRDFLETEQASELKEWLTEKVYLQGILQLPDSLFKAKNSQKSIIIIQNHGETSHQAKEVLLASVPSLKNGEQLQRFFKQFSTWKAKNIS